MAKQSKNTNKIHLKKGKLFIALGIILLIAMSGFAGYQLNTIIANQVHAPNTARLERINAIYNSLKLDADSYQPISSSVFGDKRVYEWDAGRSFSSEKVYEHGANVDVTAAELKTVIENAGFTYFDEPYPGSISTIQYHFKSDKNEYIRLSVQSKPWWDSLRNDALMSRESSFDGLDFTTRNAGPSTVTIKVNLDDNNE